MKRLDAGIVIVIFLSFGSILAVLWREGMDVAFPLFVEDFNLLLSILPKVFLGCVIGALLRVLIPAETIKRYIGQSSGVLGLLIAAGVGLLFPAGPFTIFPLAVILLQSGADRGAAIAFTSSWLLLGVNRAIIWEMPFFGHDFVVFRFLLSLPFPLLLGAMARAAFFDRLFPARKIEKGEI